MTTLSALGFLQKDGTPYPADDMSDKKRVAYSQNVRRYNEASYVTADGLLKLEVNKHYLKGQGKKKEERGDDRQQARGDITEDIIGDVDLKGFNNSCRILANQSETREGPAVSGPIGEGKVHRARLQRQTVLRFYDLPPFASVSTMCSHGKRKGHD